MKDAQKLTIEHKSIAGIMGFFDWKTVELIENVLNPDHEVDIDEIKECILDEMFSLVDRASIEDEDFYWCDIRHFHIEYRKGIGLKLIYAPVLYGED